MERAGFFSYITFSWVGRYMDKAYKHGLQSEDIPLCSIKDGCDYCGQRFIAKYIALTIYLTVIHFACARVEYMWKDEVERKGQTNASLRSVAWRFARTRVLTAVSLYLISLSFGLFGPVSIIFQIFTRRIIIMNIINFSCILWEIS